MTLVEFVSELTGVGARQVISSRAIRLDGVHGEAGVDMSVEARGHHGGWHHGGQWRSPAPSTPTYTSNLHSLVTTIWSALLEKNIS